MTPAFLQQTLLLLLAVASVPVTVLAIKGLAYFLDPLDPANPLAMESRRSVEQMFAAGWSSPLYRPALEQVTRDRLRRRPLAEVPRWLAVAYVVAVVALAAAMGWICATTMTLEAPVPPVTLGLLAAAATVTVVGLAVDGISSVIRLRAARALSGNFAARTDAAGEAEGGPGRLAAGDQVEDLALKAVAVSVTILVFRVLVALADCAAVASLLAQ